MTIKKAVQFFITLLLAAVSGFAFPHSQIAFSSLTPEDGLSQISVNDLYIDEFGAVWIGTREGLNRYDGNGIEVFRLEKDNPHSLFCNAIMRITGNQDGKLWLLCNDGISELDLSTMHFRTVDPTPAQSISYAGGLLYIARGKRIFSWDPETGRTADVLLSPGKNEIEYVHADGSSLVWGTSGDGFFTAGLDGKGIRSISGPCRATRIFRDSKGNIWGGTWEDGLLKIAPDMSVTSYGSELSSDFVRCVCEDDSGCLWIGTYKGLDCLDPSTGRLAHYHSDDGSAPGLTHSSVWCMRKDAQGNIWLGTYFGGVNWFNPEFEVYSRYGVSAEEGKGLSYPVVGRIIEDGRNNLWIATEGGGLDYLDRSTGRYRWYTPGRDGLSSNNIKALYNDEAAGILWIGTHLGGLDRLDVRTGRIRVFRSREGDPSSLPSDIVRDIAPWKDSLVVATQDGVCMFKDGHCRRLFRNSEAGRRVTMVADILVGEDGILWVAATGEGLFRYDLETGSLTQYRHSEDDPSSLSNNNVNSILRDSRGNLWLSTSGSGLDLFLPSEGRFRNFDSRSCGLLSDCIYQACESPGSGNLLLITNNGFCVFDPATESCRNYNSSNGFPLPSVNENAMCLTRGGELFLGGANGMVSFREGSQEFVQKPYRLVFTRLMAGGAEVRPSDGSGILEKAMPYTGSVVLPHDVSMFSVEFASSNYIAANRDDFVYRLEGFSDKWNNCGGRNVISYSSLSPGRYTLTVKPAGKGSEVCPPAILRIRIRPPWYGCWWAILLFSLAAAAILFYFIHAWDTSERLRQAETLNQAKLRFFTDISHEIRTPLTVIIAQVEALMQGQKFTPAQYGKILSVYQSSSQLRELITELLEFRRQEQGKLRLKVAAGNLVKLAGEFCLVFEEYAKEKGISLELVKETGRLEVWYDRKQLQKVLRNLLSNALKFTPSGGKVTVFVGQEGTDAVLSVSDTGCGIAKGDLDKVFRRFYSVGEDTRDFREGTGIGLALAKGIVEAHHGSISVSSEEGKGSRFTVRLPLGYSHFTAEELSAEEIPRQEIPEPAAAVRAADTADGPRGESPSHTILVVDDNESIRKLLAELFSPYYRVLVASDGLEGWETVQKEMPDIMVTDVLMPGMSGTDLCRKVKADISTCHIPVVMLTAQVSVEQNIEGLLTGADDYVAKPFNSRLLLSRCNNLVNSRAVLKEKFGSQPQASAMMLATNEMDKKFIDKASSLVESHLDDPSFDVAIFAREMAMSRSILFSKMKAVTGQTPNDFVVTMRLKKGAWLLRNKPGMSLTEIADTVGFSTSKYFSKCFFDKYHIRPLSYRKGQDAAE